MLARKKQRLAPHTGSTAVSASDAAASSATAAEPPQPPHTRLHADVLEATFDFLTFDELHSAMKVCQNWLAAVCLMCGLTSGHSLRPTATLDLTAICRSRLARHISKFECLDELTPTLTPVQLTQVISAMPFLRELHFRSMEQPYGWMRTLEDLRLPSTLRLVKLHSTLEMRLSSLNAVIECLGRHAPLRELHLQLARAGVAASLAPLQAAQQLTTLSVLFPPSNIPTPSPQQLQQIRQLAVSKLTLKPCSAETLLSLLQMEGPPLRWTALPTDDAIINDAIAALLPTLPCVTELDSDSFDPAALSSLAFLSQMPALQTLDLDFVDSSEQIQRRMSAALVELDWSAPLALLTSLRLGSLSLNTAQLQALLTLAPRLESLTLAWMDTFNSLSILSPVKATLQKLRVQSCNNSDLSADKLLALQELPQLTELKLVESLCEPLDTLSIVSFTPPS